MIVGSTSAASTTSPRASPRAAFHLGHTVREIERRQVTLDDGVVLPADLVVFGVGVRPAVGLAERAGLAVDRGVMVDAELQTSTPGIWAAGDIARYADVRGGPAVRIEHWVVAQRQGQVAARNMLGRGEAFRSVPFFWSQHYEVSICYVGHAESWESVEVVGRLGGAAPRCLVAYRSGDGGGIAAVVTIGRDHDSLVAERLMEQGDQAGLETLVKAARG